MINPDVGVSFCSESCHARHPKVGIALIRSYATSADFVISLRLLILRKIVQMFADCQTNPGEPATGLTGVSSTSVGSCTQFRISLVINIQVTKVMYMSM